MNYACIAIGIGKTAGGEDLPGAVNGAKMLDRWATLCGYKTALVTDENGTPVTIDRVRSALLPLLPSPRDGSDHGGPVNPPDRLIVYFAGHGLQADTSALWLLSNSMNTQEAIGMSQLQDLIASYGVPQVAIIADACRSPTVRDWNVRMTPHPVLPLGPYNMLDQIVDVDLFQAVPQYKQAFMLRASDGAPARCIFTSVLMEALHGTVEDAFTDQGEITSDTLVQYLRETVEPRARSYKVPMRPQVRASWLDKANVYIDRQRIAALQFPPLDPWPDFGAPRPPAGQGPAAGMGDLEDSADDAVLLDGVTGGIYRGREQEEAPAAEHPYQRAVAEERKVLDERRKAAAASLEGLEAAFRRTSRLTRFESGCGVTLTGAEMIELHAGAGRPERDTAMEGGFRLWDLVDRGGFASSTWTLARLADGRFVGGLAIRGFLTDHVVDASGCLATNFRMSGTSHGFRLRSEAAIGALLEGDLTADDSLELAASLRNSKHEDPVLGVIAAYLYHLAGQIESIRRMAAFYHSRSQPVPYDIGLLARVPAEVVDGQLVAKVPAVPARKPKTPLEKQYAGLFSASPAVEIPIAGRFPIMRTGWTLLEAREDAIVLDGLAELSSKVAQSPFTTFDQAAGEELLALLETDQ